MSRMTDANILFSGTEPKFSVELTSLDMIKTLSWYAQNKDTKDAQKYAVDFFKKKFKLDVTRVIKTRSSTFGFVCRIVSNGGLLCTKDQIWFDKECEKIREDAAKTQIVNTQASQTKTNVISIQDRIKEKADDCIAELEGLIDSIIVSKFKSSPSPIALMSSLNIKDAQVRYIVEWAKTKRSEFDEVLNTNDAELKEGYSNFSKPQLKKIIAFADQVILDCQKISGQAIKNRKPRKRKVKTPEQLVSKLNYCKDFEELKLKSVNPKDIVGAMQLWTYNIKRRKLGVFHADDAGGLSVKSSTIINFSESKSIQKTLRKPEEILPKVESAGKVTLRTIMDTVKSAQSNLTGRINNDIILLKVIK